MTNLDKLRTLSAHDLAKVIGHIWCLGDLDDIDDVLAEHDDNNGWQTVLQEPLEEWLNEKYTEEQVIAWMTKRFMKYICR